MRWETDVRSPGRPWPRPGKIAGVRRVVNSWSSDQARCSGLVTRGLLNSLRSCWKWFHPQRNLGLLARQWRKGRAGVSVQRRRPRMSTWHLYERWASNQKLILKDSYGTSKTRTWSRAPIQTKGLTPGTHKPGSCWNFRQWASRQFGSENISSCSTYCGKWVRLWWLHLNG